MLSTRDSLLDLRTSTGWKWKYGTIFYANHHQNKIVPILFSDKIAFKSKTERIDKGHFIMIRCSTHQEDIKIINIYAPNIRVPKYMNQIL